MPAWHEQSNMATVECAAVLCRLLGAVQANEDSSSFHNSCTCLQRIDSPESNRNSQLSSTSTNKRSGGFTCCVPGCFTNNKINPELYSVINKGVIFCVFIVYSG